MGIMEKKMETIVMGYIGFRVWSFGGLGHRGMGKKKKNATVSRVLDSWWTLLSAEFRILALGAWLEMVRPVIGTFTQGLG